MFGKPIETSHIDASDRRACVALHDEVKAEIEAGLEYLLEQRKLDPYEGLLPRAAVEASWKWTRQVPSFRV